MKLRGRARKLALSMHVLASVGWFGIAGFIVFSSFAAALTTDPSLSRGLYRVVEIAPWLSIPSGLVALGTGLLLSLGTSFGLVRYWWVVIKLAIAAVVIVTDAAGLTTRAALAAQAGGTPTRLYIPAILHLLVLGGATVLSVYKPRHLTPQGRQVVSAETTRRSASSPRHAMEPFGDGASSKSVSQCGSDRMPSPAGQPLSTRHPPWLSRIPWEG